MQPNLVKVPHHAQTHHCKLDLEPELPLHPGLRAHHHIRLVLRLGQLGHQIIVGRFEHLQSAHPTCILEFDYLDGFLSGADSIAAALHNAQQQELTDDLLLVQDIIVADVELLALPTCEMVYC